MDTSNAKLQTEPSQKLTKRREEAVFIGRTPNKPALGDFDESFSPTELGRVNQITTSYYHCY